MNGVGLLILYSFLGVGFIIVKLVEVVNGFVVADAICSKGSSYWIHCFGSGRVSVMLTRCVSWIACSFVMPLIILGLNQAYKVQVQSSSVQYQKSPKSLSEYREPMF